eukprot:3108708-Prymnesium_polylepis.1
MDGGAGRSNIGLNPLMMRCMPKGHPTLHAQRAPHRCMPKGHPTWGALWACRFEGVVFSEAEEVT